MIFLLIQAIGLAGNLIVMLAVQFNNRKLILAAQAVACMLWIIHYGLLGAITAVCLNFISFARSVIFFHNDKRWAKSTVWLWLFIALFAINSILTWEGWRSILPGVAMTNAVQDTLRGDNVSGVAHAVQALLTAALIAAGALLAVSLFNALGGVM